MKWDQVGQVGHGISTALLQGEHSAILLTFIKLTFVIKLCILSIFEWPLKTGFTVTLLVNPTFCLLNVSSSSSFAVSFSHFCSSFMISSVRTSSEGAFVARLVDVVAVNTDSEEATEEARSRKTKVKAPTLRCLTHSRIHGSYRQNCVKFKDF